MKNRAKFMTYLAALSVTLLLTLLFGDSQWKWCYLTQAYFLNKNEGRALDVPPNYSGTWKSWYRSGKLQAEDSYEAGKLEGQSKWYYESGRLRARLSWRNNKLDGKWVRYYDNDREQVEFQKDYRDGKKDGESQFFDHNSGLPKMINHYKEGMLMRQNLLRGGRTQVVFDRVAGVGDETKIIVWGLSE